MLREATAAVAAVIGPLAFTVNAGGATVAVAAIGLSASAALGLTSERRWWPRAGVVVAATALAAAIQSVPLAVWLGASLVLSDWVLRRKRPAPFVPPAAPAAAAPLAVLIGLATLTGVGSGSTRHPLVFIGVAVLVTALGAWRGPQLERVSSAVGRRAASLVGTIGFFCLGCAVVVVPWIGQRLLRVDPLSWPTRPGTAWVQRHRPDLAPTEPWSPEPAASIRSAPERLRRALALPLSLLLLGGALMGAASTARWIRSPAPHDGVHVEQWTSDVPPAYAGEEWYPEYQQDIEWLTSSRPPWRPLHLFRLSDFETRHVNVRNGVRSSWVPPPCDCERVTVWMYGGSTTFGLGQRDAHTIASELARSAWESGVALDVSNRGVPGHLHWIQSQRFAWDLTIEDPPDLVVFYDGVNEIWAARGLNDRGGHLDQPYEPLTEEVWAGIDQQWGPSVHPPPDGARALDPESLPSMSGRAIGELATRLYARSLKLSGDVASANSIPLVRFWQPARLSRPSRDDEPRYPAGDEKWNRDLYRGAEASIPDGVIDLSGVFDEIDAPLFSDDVHHNELGARIVAEAIFEELRPRLQPRLVASRGETG